MTNLCLVAILKCTTLELPPTLAVARDFAMQSCVWLVLARLPPPIARFKPMPYSPAMIVRRPSGFIEPCLPSKAVRPPSGPLWVHEIKHDGYRLMVRREGSRVRCFTRNGHDWADASQLLSRPKRRPAHVRSVHPILMCAHRKSHSLGVLSQFSRQLN